MVALTINHNFPDVQRQLDALHDDIAARATVRAVNRTMESARTVMGREIRKTYNLSAGYVRERLHIRRASFKAGRLRIEATLRAGDSNPSRSANVIAFLERAVTLAEGKRRKKAEGQRPQLRFKIKRVGAKQIIRGAFVGNKGRTVFQRTTSKRLPIEPVMTIGIKQMFNARRVNDVVVQLIEAKFPANWAHEVSYYTARFGRR